MINKLSHHIHFRVLALYDVVLEDSFRIEQILLLISSLLGLFIVFLRFVIILVLLNFVLAFILMMLNVRCQYDNLFGSHKVNSIIRFLRKRASLHEIYLLEELELLPLLVGRKLVM